MTNDIINVFAQGLVNTNADLPLGLKPAYFASAIQQPKGKLPATCIPETHGSRTAVNYNRLQIKTLFSAATNCTQQSLPPPSPTSLPCSASSPLSYSNFHSIFYFAIFSNLSFLPSLSSLLLLASSLFCICSCSLQHGSLILSLSPQCPPFH